MLNEMIRFRPFCVVFLILVKLLSKLICIFKKVYDMKKAATIISLLIIWGLSTSAVASTRFDSLKNFTVNRIVPYISLGMENILTGDRTIIQKDISAGVTINEKINIGVFTSWNVNDLSFEMIGLPKLRMKYMQGGVLTSFDQRISRLFSLNVGAKVGQGSARILDYGNDMGVLKQRVVIIHPDVGLEMSPFGFVKIKLNFGYRLMTDQKMQEIIKGGLTGLSYGLSLKIDLFRKKYFYGKRSYSFTHTR